jgi:hypothetical protein
MQMQNFVNWNLSFVRKVGKSNHSPCKLTLKAFKLLASDLKRFKRHDQLIFFQEKIIELHLHIKISINCIFTCTRLI